MQNVIQLPNLFFEGVVKMPKRKSACPSFKDMFGFCVKAWVLFHGSQVASALEFPENGNFKQQSDFVNSLTGRCREDVGNVVSGIADAENPFNMVDAHSKSEPTRDIKVWRHEFDAEHGVVFKRTLQKLKENESLKPSTDTEEVMIGGQSEDGRMQPITFRFQRGADGLMKVVSKEKVKVTEFAEGVEQANKEGLVVRADNCYTSRLRDRKTA